MNPHDLVGKPAPEFSLPDQNGTIRMLGDFRGRWLVVYFYPKDDTPGCTKEACGFRERWEAYQQKNIAVVGISKDSTLSHKKFFKKYALPFFLLSDPSGDTINAYGAWGKKRFLGKSYDGIFRYTYLIDPAGIVRKVYTTVKPPEHAQEILTAIENSLY